MTGSAPTRELELVAALDAVRARIAAACTAAGRAAGSVALVAVSKTWPATDAAILVRLGQRDLGESRDQEAGPKAAALAGQRPAPRWHFLGQLQRNKARSVASYCAVVHSYDRAALAPLLARGAEEAHRAPPGVLVQVSLDGVAGRGGVPPAQVLSLAGSAAAQGLDVLGVMAVAPAGPPSREPFDRLAAVSAALRAEHPGASWISAGMSGDLEAAVAAGSTHVRVGTALFGHRPPVSG